MAFKFVPQLDINSSLELVKDYWSRVGSISWISIVK